MATSHTTEEAPGDSTPTLAVSLRSARDGPEIHVEPVTHRDLTDVYGEVWLATCLRKGHPDVPLEAVPMRLVPALKPGSDRECNGFVVQARNPGGGTTVRAFTATALEDAAYRASQRLLLAGVLAQGDPYYYEPVVVRRRPGDPVPGREGGPSRPEGAAPAPFTVTVKNPPLVYLTRPVRPLVERAETVGPVDAEWCPVFYTREAFEKAERLARRGAAFEKRVETGGALVGPLCSCPETGEFFVVVCDVLELEDAEVTQFSLTYSGQTWAHIQAAVRAVQAVPATRAYRLVGQAHGHNFLPHDGEKDCTACDQRATCTLTSAFVSTADKEFHRSVFARQPFAVCHVFGVTAHEKPAHALFGLRNGQLLERGFYRIADFSPEPS